uniref:Uncharacterized protein n=1 Tax=Lepeophtheirus salmonis TaxID=72036 RepID=A0A0K2U2P8_LEPSM
MRRGREKRIMKLNIVDGSKGVGVSSNRRCRRGRAMTALICISQGINNINGWRFHF